MNLFHSFTEHHILCDDCLILFLQILEVLYCKQWSRLDGLGALVITPTRELAYQIYDTLLKMGQHHNFSTGLIIGGKDLKFETKRMDQYNVVICTPGRLLQHMDENQLFTCVNLQVIKFQVLVINSSVQCIYAFHHPQVESTQYILMNTTLCQYLDSSVRRSGPLFRHGF